MGIYIYACPLHTRMCIFILTIMIICRTSKFTKGDAFIGFQKDTPASVIFQATNLLRSACAAAREGTGGLKRHTMDILKWSQLKVEEDYTEEQEAWKEAVSFVIVMGQCKLLYVCTYIGSQPEQVPAAPNCFS